VVEEDVQSIRRGRAKNDPLNDAKEINITPPSTKARVANKNTN
jgi:hypothetical protein